MVQHYNTYFIFIENHWIKFMCLIIINLLTLILSKLIVLKLKNKKIYVVKYK